jgi:hypothetical protein
MTGVKIEFLDLLEQIAQTEKAKRFSQLSPQG